jgi:RNase P/RNase MRP subunit p30
MAKVIATDAESALDFRYPNQVDSVVVVLKWNLLYKIC